MKVFDGFLDGPSDARYIRSRRQDRGAGLFEPQHVPFPGFKEAFHSEWPEKPIAVIDTITAQEINEQIFIANRHEAIHGCVDIFVSRLVQEENRLEAPPSFWFVVIPEVIYELGRPQ